MVIRALCLSLVLCAGPASPWVAARCCDPIDACCTGDVPSCPVLPDGECSIAAAGQTPAAISPGYTSPELPSSPAAPLAWTCESMRRVDPSGSPPGSSLPRYLTLGSLRN